MKIIFISGAKMESTLYAIRRHTPEMGPAEKRIAAYVLQNAVKLVGVSITELARACGCGEATVVRFARRLGFEGYQALKIRLAQEVGGASKLTGAVTKEDSCHEIFRKRVRDLEKTLLETQASLDPASLETAAEWIMGAKRVVIFGLGNSASVAADAAHKFLRLGLDAVSCSDNHMQAILASHLDRDCVAIGVSHSGSSRDVVEALELAKIGGARTVAVTNYGSSPLVDAADLALFTRSEETARSILALDSRIAQLLIFDTLYSFIFLHADKASLAAVYNTEYALQKKKY